MNRIRISFTITALGIVIPIVKFIPIVGKKFAKQLTDTRKNYFIALVLGTKEGRYALAQAMIEPIKEFL